MLTLMSQSLSNADIPDDKHGHNSLASSQDKVEIKVIDDYHQFSSSQPNEEIIIEVNLGPFYMNTLSSYVLRLQLQIVFVSFSYRFQQSTRKR